MAVTKLWPNADGRRTANQCSEENVGNVCFPALKSTGGGDSSKNAKAGAQ